MNKCVVNGTVTYQQAPCPTEQGRKQPSIEELNAQEKKRRAAAAASAPEQRAPAPAAATSSFSCDGRTHCSQMRSCGEAKYFLANCPGTKMDGDRDGTPCEEQWCTSPLEVKPRSFARARWQKISEATFFAERRFIHRTSQQGTEDKNSTLWCRAHLDPAHVCTACDGDGPATRLACPGSRGRPPLGLEAAHLLPAPVILLNAIVQPTFENALTTSLPRHGAVDRSAILNGRTGWRHASNEVSATPRACPGVRVQPFSRGLRRRWG